ncbi:hypothetical protein SKAU_G00253490 [Synaphobranchus kaupii]|uniref:Uncharacterized protein n=1 Tax=Synaphobranchus kaupii TaxID=118154 RepID=A0A9Q1F3B2_SYNKA|nr:hypothetical protein SKAU_G00253490 [Synaphobranchus kaupii]
MQLQLGCKNKVDRCGDESPTQLRRAVVCSLLAYRVTLPDPANAALCVFLRRRLRLDLALYEWPRRRQQRALARGHLCGLPDTFQHFSSIRARRLWGHRCCGPTPDPLNTVM